MATNHSKPSLVPTLLSAKTLLWSFVYLAAFSALLWVYSSHGRLVAARERLARPSPTPVKSELFTALLPAGWAEYSLDGGTLIARRQVGAEIPAIGIAAERQATFAFRALDLNPAVALQTVEDVFRQRIVFREKSSASMRCIGSESMTVKPGIEAGHFLFTSDIAGVEFVMFFAGDIRYLICGIWPEGDAGAREECGIFFRRLFEDFTIPEVREAIARPTVHSGRFTAAGNEAAYVQISREMALWKLFAARAEAEPDAALLPALQHFREALRLFSSIRQERTLLGTEDFARYTRLLELRRADVDEWFVILDKLVAMRDWPQARKQAQWIITHATLTGERADIRRAMDILSNRIPAGDGD